MKILVEISPEGKEFPVRVRGGLLHHGVFSPYLVGDIQSYPHRLERVRSWILSGIKDSEYQIEGTGNACTLTVRGNVVRIENEFSEERWVQLRGEEMLKILDAWEEYLVSGKRQEVEVEVSDG